MFKKLAFLRLLLFPFSWLYSLVLAIRNLLFDKGFLPSYQSKIFTIGVGNLSMGGTGKTPTIAYLIEELLAKGLKVGVVSRGYGRSTQGLREVQAESSASESGDEPLLLKTRFAQIEMWVAEKRILGVQKLEEIGVDVILLDDNFQHRYVNAHFQLLLTKATDLFTKDYVLPAGNLREARKGAKRADAVLVTNCGENENHEAISADISKYCASPIFFSKHLMSDIQWVKTESVSSFEVAILIAGIANPSSLLNHIQQQALVVKKFFYKDHHNYTIEDLNNWLQTAEQQLDKGNDYAILMTEKDWVKIKDLAHLEVFKLLKIGIVPVQIAFNSLSPIQQIFEELLRHKK